MVLAGKITGASPSKARAQLSHILSIIECRRGDQTYVARNDSHPNCYFGADVLVEQLLLGGGKPSDYGFTRDSNPVIEGVDDAAEFKSLMASISANEKERNK